MKTVNLELSKQLKEAGYPQDASFCWSKGELYPTISGVAFEEDYASPTADEILDQLPGIVKDKFGQDQFLMVGLYKGYSHDKKFVKNGAWEIYYTNIYSVNYVNYHGEEQYLADAAACMYLYLKKENLL